MKPGGHNYHPSRISNRQKMQRKRDYDAYQKGKKKPAVKPIDLKKENWSI